MDFTSSIKADASKIALLVCNVQYDIAIHLFFYITSKHLIVVCSLLNIASQNIFVIKYKFKPILQVSI